MWYLRCVNVSMEKYNYLLLAVLVLNTAYAVLSAQRSDPNYNQMERMIRDKETFLSPKNLETCSLTGLLPSGPESHLALGQIRVGQLYTINVIWKVPLHKQEHKLRFTYSVMRTIYLKLLAKYPCNKWDMMKRRSIPFYMFPIRHNGLKFYAMYEFSRDVRAILRTSPEKNPKSNLNMLSTDDVMLFADRLVNVVRLMHEIDFAFGPIEINMFMEYEFVGEDGKAEKTFVAMDMKSTKEKTRRLVKINWLEVLEAIVEVMGAFKRSADYGTANGKSVSYLLRFEGWIFPCEEMKDFIKEQLNIVVKNDILDEKFVKSFKAQVKKYQVSIVSVANTPIQIQVAA